MFHFIIEWCKRDVYTKGSNFILQIGFLGMCLAVEISQPRWWIADEARPKEMIRLGRLYSLMIYRMGKFQGHDLMNTWISISFDPATIIDGNPHQIPNKHKPSDPLSRWELKLGKIDLLKRFREKE